MPVSRDDLPLTTAHLSYLLDTCGDGFVVCDAEQSIVLINREAERIFGFEEGELLGELVTTLMPERYAKRHDEAFRRRVAAPQQMPIRYVEVHGRKKSGEEFPMEVRFTFTPLGDVKYFTGSVRDVSAQVAAREELERRAAEIERLRKELEQERDYLREEVKASGQFGDIIGHSPALGRVLAQVEAVAKTDATVLVFGESGAGKELIARAIHEQSPRAAKALVKVNCATVPRELFESEFFGHRKGAFTGAHRDRVGRFQLANGGTLFLDEVGEIPLELQSKLLRVLQEQEFERVGDERTQKIDVRIVAATNRDLREEAKAGRFREDLYYRLGVFPIELPPLRERSEDIIPLALHFLARAAQNLKVPVPKLPTAVAERLRAYVWPGNIRELQNVMERAAILAMGGAVSESMLAIDLTENHSPHKPSPTPRRSSAPDLDATAVRRALEEHDGNIAHVAAALGLSRQALYRRLDKLGIERPTKK